MTQAARTLGPSRTAVATRPFRPWSWAVGPHRQTLLGYWRRRFVRWAIPTHDRIVSSEDDVQLLLRVSRADGPAGRRALVVVHGMGGSDQSGYVLATGLAAWARGWSVVRANMRGAGDSEAMTPRLYNAGLSRDLLAVLRDVSAFFETVAVAGFSLGGHLALLTLCRHEAELPANVVAAAAVCAPLDLGACADAVALPGNRIYQRYFMKGLIGSYRRLQRLRPDLCEAGRAEGLATLREFDDAITAPYGGFGRAATYYERCSVGPLVERIARPTLILSSADDPIVPAESLLRWPVDGSGFITREVVFTGGHVGFVAPSSAPGHFWAAERLLDFFETA